MDSPSVPKQIGDYEVASVVGRDGTGTTFQATDPRAGRKVTIKAVTTTADDPDLLLLKFYRETKGLPQLQHENVATVLELGYGNGQPYVVMDSLEGETLDAIISARRPMSTPDKLKIIIQVCAGLSCAHARGIVHRDVRPANIVILKDGTAKIVDFGLGRLSENRFAQPGSNGGSVNYLSPEQAKGSVDLDARTDIYSTGIVLFRLLAGVLPFEGENSAVTLKKIIENPPPMVGKFIKNCPKELEDAIRKALAKNRDERYPSAEAFALDLARVQQQVEKQMLADCLRQGRELLARANFASAKEQVQQALKMAPQNAEAAELQRLISEAEEQQRRAEQVRQLQVKAEELLLKKEYGNALQLVEQGLKIDSAASGLLRVRETILSAQKKVAKFREALERADLALQRLDFKTANDAINRALYYFPDDPQARKLASEINTRIEEQRNEQIAAVESVFSDVRVRLSFGQSVEVLKILDGIQTQLAQLPSEYRQRAEALKKEAQALDKQREPATTADTAPYEFGEPSFNKTAAGPASPPFSATAVIPNSPPFNPAPPPPVTPPPEVSKPATAQWDSIWREDSISRPPSVPPKGRAKPAAPKRANLGYQFDDASDNEVERPVQPPRRQWQRSTLVLSIAVVVVIAVIIWVAARPKPTPTRSLPPTPKIVASYSYAEINAEPWATVRAITPMLGEAKAAIGGVTPLRVKLPPGDYSITLEGPNRETKPVVIKVPSQGGVTAFAVFRKPDLNRLVSRQ